ncbi:hypothetical protein Mgra_00001854 [Meloidogyne graminicola]|uniref:Uncharacterized protein n=1 Tax=Meloidogyne graminicola TaxID=189291 RepID=A0A8S9ZYD3_9BILA|nr:hypothetical protein Mgra_00001854 [Meloidogyne graminicola]
MAFDRASFTVCGFVLFNMAITLFIWCYIYEMKCEYFDKPTLLDLNSTLTTGNALIDGILNGLFIATIIALMGIILSQCISHQLISYVILFVKSSFLMTAFIMPANIIYDFYLKFLGSNNSYIYLYTIITSLSFTLLIITAYFTNNFPSFLQQIFSVFNCSFISIYYLRFLPRHTIWFLMIAVIFWDLFAVNSSFGPLKVAALNAQNFNEGILRFMFFIAKNGKDEEESDDNNNEIKKMKFLLRILKLIQQMMIIF